MKYRIFIGLWWFTQLIFGQDVLPFIENYSKQDYKGDNQIWSLTQGTDNALYFANNRFLLRYNGVKWEKYTLPHNTVIRSVFAYEDKIFSGSYNEFGYWKREKGKMNYYSLVPVNFFEKDRSEEVWKIFEWHGNIYFQTFNEIYEYDFKYVKRIGFPAFTSYSFLVKDKLLIATINNGIYKYEDGLFSKIEAWNAISGQVIHHIADVDQKTYIFTKNNGVYVADEDEINEWHSSLQNVLKKQLINTALVVDSLHIAIGTASNGLYLVDLKDDTYVNFNKSSAIQNNSILNLTLDKEKDLWVGLDNGISHIEINSPYRLFTDKTGVLGSVYAIAPMENELLLGSNHGLFRYVDRKLSFIEGSQGQIWDIYKSGLKYIIGHNDGTFVYEHHVLTKPSSINGGWKFKKSVYQDSYVQSNYTGIAFYESPDLLKDGKKLYGFTGPIKDFVQISPSEIIGSHVYRGLFKFKYDDEYRLLSEENLTQKSHLKNDFGVKIFPFKNDVLYFINNQWYYYDKIQNKLLEHQTFNGQFKDITDVIPIDDTTFGVVKNDMLYIITYKDRDFKWYAVPSKIYSGRIINNETSIIKVGHKLYVNLDDGFLIISKYDAAYQEKEQKVVVEAFYNGNLIENKKIPYNKSVEINVVSEFFGSEKTALYYSINDGTIYPIVDGYLILSNLNSGSYKFNVFYKSASGFEKIKDFEFSVKVPWYFSYWMLMVYVTLLGMILYIYYKWNKIRFIEKLKLKEEEIKHKSELKQLEIETENKLKIQEYEKHILENQVQLKANEIAGKSLSLAKQTELIESIQDILQKENDVQSIKNKIVKSIKINRLNKNEWKSFENNLLKSNEDFVKILTIKNPHLTSKDIKLCIYLKMNLSSKEIAPLMNISYRGVELHRYRLRKKLQIDKDTNLNTYLTNL